MDKVCKLIGVKPPAARLKLFQMVGCPELHPNLTRLESKVCALSQNVQSLVEDVVGLPLANKADLCRLVQEAEARIHGMREFVAGSFVARIDCLNAVVGHVMDELLHVERALKLEKKCSGPETICERLRKIQALTGIEGKSSPLLSQFREVQSKLSLGHARL